MTKKLKAILAALLACLMLLSTVACTSTEKPAGDSSADSSADSSDDSTDDNSSTAYVDPWKDSDANGNAMRDPNYKVLNYENMKGIWLSQYDMQSLYCTGNGQLPESTFKTKVDTICKSISKQGFNTIIVQVRPNGDSFYPSEYYCPSEFVVSAYGQEFKYDMLRIFIKTAHKYNLSFHAWINPMRLMKDEDISKVDKKYKVGEWYNDPEKREKYMHQVGNYWYLVPGWDEVKQLVCDGAKELCTKYNIDALQIDDYFYPTTELAFDKEHYALFSAQYPRVNVYRIDMVNSLVNMLYKTTHEAAPDLEFGISPAGNINNNLTSLYADVTKWCSMEGFCDFIIPQVYWGFEDKNNSNKFDVCCADWEKLCKSDSVRLIIGIDLDNAKTPDSDEFKNNKDCIKKQLVHLTTMEKNSGFAMFSYQSLFSVSGALIHIKQERENFIPVIKSFPDLPTE